MMTGEKSNRQKMREIVALLPKENCGKCGFQNCGGFALAAIEGQTSFFGCKKTPPVGYEIGKLLGIESPEKFKVPAGTSESRHRGKHHGKGRRIGHHIHSFGHGGDDRWCRHSGSHHSKLGSHAIQKILRHLV